MKTLSSTVKIILGVVVVLGVAIGGAYLTGAVQQPSVGVEDPGDWGNVSQERTEIITSLWVHNPNQLGVAIGGNVRASYQLYLNGVNLAEGTKRGINVPPGNNTVKISTEVRNQKIPVWWVAFIQNNETIPVRAETRATVKAGPLTASPELPPFNKTLLPESTPVISSLSNVASEAEGRYAKPISEDQFQLPLVDEEKLDQITGVDSSTDEVTVGYEIRRGWASWGEVSQDSTVVYFHFIVHNPSEVVYVPAEPENLGLTVEMNDAELFKAQGDDTTLQNPSNFSTREAVDRRLLAPGETKEAVYAVEMDNTKIDEWFTSHVQRGEQTDIRVEFHLLFSAGNTTFQIPEQSQLAYTCQLQTGIFVDGQETQTTCGDAPVVDSSDNAPERSDGESDDSTTPTESDAEQATSTPTATPTDEPPTARIEANETRGEAPLPVSFNASTSTDPNGDIARYIWRFKDGTPPAEGESVTHTFRTAGEYQVELVVIDSQGHRDSTTVTVTVEPRIG